MPDIVIIGGGPGGYVAAIQAAKLGAQVTLVEKDTLGGTCLNRGCIPTKSLVQSADLFDRIRSAATFGITVEKASVDFPGIINRKETVIKKLVSGLTFLMTKNKIKVIRDTATLMDNRTVGLQSRGEVIRADNIIIASGSKSSVLPVEGINNPGVINSDQALSLKELPESMLIIGGGVIGLEFAGIMHRLGSKVTIIEMLPHLVAMADTEIISAVERALKKDGIQIYTGARVVGIKRNAGGQESVSFTTGADAQLHEATAGKILVCVGRQANTDGLGAGQTGLILNKGRIAVNEYMETNLPGVYAVGDVVGRTMLAHVAMEEGKCAVENILGNPRRMQYGVIPKCVYSSPEIAWVGLTEDEAKQQFAEVKTGHFPFYASGRAVTLNETVGMVKIITAKKYGQILGVHILGPQASELIAEAALAMQVEATFTDLVATIHAHPTLSESLQEASQDIMGLAVDI
jgi:dihydrolipoamide dehydrogenase